MPKAKIIFYCGHKIKIIDNLLIILILFNCYYKNHIRVPEKNIHTNLIFKANNSKSVILTGAVNLVLSDLYVCSFYKRIYEMSLIF